MLIKINFRKNQKDEGSESKSLIINNANHRNSTNCRAYEIKNQFFFE